MKPPQSVLDGRSGEAPTFVRDDLYEVRKTPGAGIATFATSFISCGTRLFCEEALIVAPDEAQQLELFGIVSALPEIKQAQFWALAADSKPSKDVGWINDLRQSCKSDESFNGLVDTHEKAWSIYETNRFSMRFPDHQYTIGVFAKAARLNHSCAPNLFHRYNPKINRLTIHALRDITPGEELNTSYIDICHPTVIRRQMLKGWGFICLCPVCESTDVEKDHSRKVLEDLLKKVRKRDKQQQASGGNWTERDYEKSLVMIERGMRLMEQQGMAETDTLGYLLPLAAICGFKCHQEDKSLAWIERLMQLERRCLGEDSNEYLDAVDLSPRYQSTRLT